MSLNNAMQCNSTMQLKRAIPNDKSTNSKGNSEGTKEGVQRRMLECLALTFAMQYTPRSQLLSEKAIWGAIDCRVGCSRLQPGRQCPPPCPLDFFITVMASSDGRHLMDGSRPLTFPSRPSIRANLITHLACTSLNWAAWAASVGRESEHAWRGRGKLRRPQRTPLCRGTPRRMRRWIG